MSTRDIPRVLTLNVSRDIPTCLATLIQLISRQLTRTDTSATASVVDCKRDNTSRGPNTVKQRVVLARPLGCALPRQSRLTFTLSDSGHIQIGPALDGCRDAQNCEQLPETRSACV